MNTITNPMSPTASQPLITNDEMAAMLERVAELLDAQEANPFRVRAYRVAAANLRSMPQAVANIYAQEGVDRKSVV